jgi:hypothetical protein
MIIMDSLNKNELGTANRVIDRKEGSKVAVTGADGTPLAVNFFGVKPDGS